MLLGVLALAVIYALGFKRARSAGETRKPGYGRAALFAGGLLATLIALVSPVDSMADQLMLMHMIQHILLLDIAPILLILGLTKVLLRPVTRRVHAIERRAGYFAHPAFAVIAYAGFMWIWHIPAMYDLALRHDGIHVLEHLCFAAAGTLYWWHIAFPDPLADAPRRDGPDWLHGLDQATGRAARRDAGVCAEFVLPLL